MNQTGITVGFIIKGPAMLRGNGPAVILNVTSFHNQ